MKKGLDLVPGQCRIGKEYLGVTRLRLCLSKFVLRMEWRRVTLEAGRSEGRLCAIEGEAKVG